MAELLAALRKGCERLVQEKFFVSSGRNPKKVRGEKIKGTHTRSKGQDFKKQKIGAQFKIPRTGTIQVQAVDYGWIIN